MTDQIPLHDLADYLDANLAEPTPTQCLRWADSDPQRLCAVIISLGPSTAGHLMLISACAMAIMADDPRITPSDALRQMASADIDWTTLRGDLTARFVDGNDR